MPCWRFVNFYYLGQAGIYTFLLDTILLTLVSTNLCNKKVSYLGKFDFWGRQKVLALHIFVVGGGWLDASNLGAHGFSTERARLGVALRFARGFKKRHTP